jgi:hypothetical protein
MKAKKLIPFVNCAEPRGSGLLIIVGKRPPGLGF